MSRLHKKRISLTKKCYIIFVLLIVYGIYKNGFVPLLNGYGSFMQLLSYAFFPIISFLIGFFFDYIFKNKEVFNNKFYSLLFVMSIPISTNICLYVLFLIVLLFIYNCFFRKFIKDKVNFIAVGKILLIVILGLFNMYTYKNALELSGLYQYSFIDTILGYNTSGIYISNTILLVVGAILLLFDEYYKKDVLIYSYCVYLISLVIYSFIKSDIVFFITNMFSSNILFALIFISTLSCYTPYKKNGKVIYGSLLGLIIIPISLLTNFYEGVYISIIFVNIVINCLEFVFKNEKLQIDFNKMKQK